MMRRRIAGIAALAVLLAGCQVNFVTRIEPSGAGSLTTEVGLSADEVAQLKSFAGEAAASPCDAMTLQAPDGSVAPGFVEEKRGEETWCVSTQTFEDGSELETLYRQLDGITIHELVEREGIFVYDIDVDLQAPQGIPAVAAITWAVVLPGKIGDHNADRVDGPRLEWLLQPGETRRLTASSDQYGVSLPSGLGDMLDRLPLSLGVAAACLCLGTLLIMLALVFVLRSRKRSGNDTE